MSEAKTPNKEAQAKAAKPTVSATSPAFKDAMETVDIDANNDSLLRDDASTGSGITRLVVNMAGLGNILAPIKKAIMDQESAETAGNTKDRVEGMI